MTQLTFLLEEPPAKIIPWQDFAQAWLGIGGHSLSPTLKLLHDTAPAGLSGKMCLESCPATTEKTLQNFWATSAARKSKSRKGGGETAVSFRGSLTPTGSPTVCLTLNTCEWTGLDGLFLKDDGVSSLSDILEAGDVPQRYYLSPKACLGILRRAEKRGKSLPQSLHDALKAVASGQTSTAMGD